jgi:hypothetical protein
MHPSSLLEMVSKLLYTGLRSSFGFYLTGREEIIGVGEIAFIGHNWRHWTTHCLSIELLILVSLRGMFPGMKRPEMTIPSGGVTHTKFPDATDRIAHI